MMLNSRAIASKLILVLLAGGTWWLAEKLTPKDIFQHNVGHDPVDYYSKNIHRTVLTAEGLPKEDLFAPLMTHYKDDDRTELDKPVQTLYKEGGEPWVIHSDAGTLLSGGKAVLLRGDVLITRKNEKGEELRIMTSNVKYIPDQEYAETAEHVLMLGPDDASSGTGAQVYFEPFLVINLLADVRRKHEIR
ncbi:MAG: LPS export ABC transporter periplasmic protein LptC [Proteobacteria bacterium]|nr:LPS export ABC transporter periplasmic protein LptC [Pseudomonadota bacterium]